MPMTLNYRHCRPFPGNNQKATVRNIRQPPLLYNRGLSPLHTLPPFLRTFTAIPNDIVTICFIGSIDKAFCTIIYALIIGQAADCAPHQ